MSKGLHDAFGRSINYMRISITDRCNFRCAYCMPLEGVPNIPHEEILTFEEILNFCAVASRLGISRYKITGGEPFCRSGAVEFMSALKKLPGVEQVSITTNGALLLKHAEALASMGISAVTVSLDSLNPERFAAITRSKVGLPTVLAGIERLEELGIPVKINTVAMSGVNDGDIIPLVEYALGRNHHIRFIELMPVGSAQEYSGISPEDVRKEIEQVFGPLEHTDKHFGNGPAEYFTVPNHEACVGFISALSHKFCTGCNRIRLTAKGFLKACLHHSVGVDIRPAVRGSGSEEAIEGALRETLAKKPQSHTFEEKDGTVFYMNSVGG